jgi:hypothetical protein
MKKIKLLITLFVFITPVCYGLEFPTIGCLSFQGGKYHFVSPDLDKESVKQKLSEALNNGEKVVDPCLTGQSYNIDSVRYDRAAFLNPVRFEARLEVEKDGSFPSLIGHRHLPSYRLIDFTKLSFPGISGIFPQVLTDDGRLYAAIYDEDYNTSVGYYKNGRIVITHQNAYPLAANNKKISAGGILSDPVNYFTQAAVFYPDGTTKLIPRIPGEISSEIFKINDRGTMLLSWYDENYTYHLDIIRNGIRSPRDFGPDIPVAGMIDINDKDQISGTTLNQNGKYLGFRYDLNTGKATLLYPQATETDAWAMGINNYGDIVGYSFITNGTERIGVWDKSNRFREYFVEGTDEYPTISNSLLINDNKLIVVTYISRPAEEAFKASYLIPRPGVRFLVQNLVDGITEDYPLSIINSLNDKRMMSGWGDTTYLLDTLNQVY